MAKIFLDTNYFIDIVEQRAEINIKSFEGHILCISPLSIHILVYVYKYAIPHKKLAKVNEFFSLIPIDSQVVENSLSGPTRDFEDNLQLHSAAINQCDYFLTHDKKILSLGFFGTLRILEKL